MYAVKLSDNRNVFNIETGIPLYIGKKTTPKKFDVVTSIDRAKIFISKSGAEWLRANFLEHLKNIGISGVSARLVKAKKEKPKPSRRKNPVVSHSSKQQKEIIQAIQLYQRFRLSDPKFVDEYDVNYPEVAMLIGHCDAVEYTTRRNGKIEAYRHEFTGKSRPLLCASFDGKQLIFIGGAYDFTDEGIVDRK